MGRRQEIELDELENAPNYSRTIYALVFCIFLYIVDVFSDIIVAIMHFKDGHLLYFILTCGFIAIASIVVTIVSIVWYLTDKQMEKTFQSMHLQQPRINIWRILPMMCLLAPLIRYVDALRYIMKAIRLHRGNGVVLRSSAKETVADCEEGVKSELEDTAFLMIIRAGLQCAPQIILQLAVVLANSYETNSFSVNSTGVVQLISMSISFTSLVYSQSSLRSAQQDDVASASGSQSAVGIIFHNTWIFLISAARVMALAIFASTYPEWTVLVCGVHWVIMYTWLFNMDTSFCFDRRFLERLLAIATSMVYVFFYIDLLDNPSFWRYLVYHLMQFLENMALITLWTIWSETTLWYRYYAPAVHVAFYILGLVTQLIYYRHFHPKSQLIRLRRRIPRSWKSFGLELTGHSSVMSEISELSGVENKRSSTAT